MGRKLKYAEADLLNYAQQGLDNAEIAKKLGTQAQNIAQRLRKIRAENGIAYGKPIDKPAPRPQKWNLAVNDTVSYKGGSRYMVKTVTKTEFTIQMVSYNARLNKPPVLTFSKADYCSGKLRMRRVNLPPVTIYKLNSREKSADKEGERVSKTITDTERVAREIAQFQADEMPCDDMYCDENEKGFCTTDRCVKTDSLGYWENVCDIQSKQTAKGVKKYGQILEKNTAMTTDERLTYLQEEMIDALMYVEHIKADKPLTADWYQDKAMRTAGDSRGKELLDNGIYGLIGEVGEAADIVKKHKFQGHDLDKAHLIEELGDIAWYLAITATAINTPLSEILELNIKKLQKRYPEGFSADKSINREGK